MTRRTRIFGFAALFVAALGIAGGISAARRSKPPEGSANSSIGSLGDRGSGLQGKCAIRNDKVAPDVYDALAEDPNGTVAVFIALHSDQAGNHTPGTHEEAAKETLNRLASRLAPGEVTLGGVFLDGRLIGGEVNASGLEKLANQPEVAGIELCGWVEVPERSVPISKKRQSAGK